MNKKAYSSDISRTQFTPPFFSLFWKVPVTAQHRAKWICMISFVPFSTFCATAVLGVPYWAIFPNSAPFIFEKTASVS